MTDTSHLSCLDRASLVRREPLACPIFTTLARSSARTRELLEGGRHTVYEGRVDSKQWEFHLHVGATPFGRAILFDLGDVWLRLSNINTPNRKYPESERHPGAGSLLMLAGVSLLLRLQYRELKWRSTYSARIFYERFFTEFEWILDEANLRMKADENLEFRLYR